MKKILLSVLFTGISVACFAQFPTFGIKGGVNFATLSASGTENNVVPGTNLYQSSGSVTSFNAGIFADFKIGHISLQPAINYTGKGGTFHGFTGPLPTAGGGAPSTSEVNSNYKIYYVQVPLNIAYHIPVIIGDLYFGAGGYAAWGTSGKVKLSYKNTTLGNGSSSNDVKFGDEDGDIRKKDFGADAIAGLKLKGGLLLNANYDLGFANILPKSNGVKMKTRVLGVSAGFAF